MPAAVTGPISEDRPYKSEFRQDLENFFEENHGFPGGSGQDLDQLEELREFESYLRTKRDWHRSDCARWICPPSRSYCLGVIPANCR